MKKKKTSLFAAVMLAGILLGIHNGQIALWQGDDPQPYKTFPYNINQLPFFARKALERGIRVESEEELNRLLESYLS